MRPIEAALAAILVGLGGGAFAQAADTPSAAPSEENPSVEPTDQNRQFFAAFAEQLRDYPDAAARFKPADFGSEPQWDQTWTCDEVGEFGVDCRPVEAEE